MTSFASLQIPERAFVLRDVRTPLACLDAHAALVADRDGLARVDIAVADGRIAAVAPAAQGPQRPGDVDLAGRQVWPTLVDVHAHLDKGHVFSRAPNPTGTFDDARATAGADRDAHWTRDDILRRMTFGLRCAQAHGVGAIRTHLDTYAGHWETTWSVFADVRAEWAGRVTLQAVALAPLAMVREPFWRAVADRAADLGALLGGAIRATGDDLPGQLAQIEADLESTFVLAKARGLDVDLHVDESGEPAGAALPFVARAAMRHGYEGRVTCGHCCSLALQDDATRRDTIALVADTGLSIVSLPTVNMYLQDRAVGRTPRWRGVAPIRELRAAGVRVAVAGDNCRDPFHAYGDHDMLDTFRQAARIAHLDHPFGDAAATAGPAPAAIMGLDGPGTIRVGRPADLILLNARGMDQLVARPQADRIVLRDGRRIASTPPDYEELEPA